ncbi:MAG: VWA domain-containing protein [Spirochaetales bacterium]|nr:VWA domain-containing protein [Spirochaetales bacterium]
MSFESPIYLWLLWLILPLLLLQIWGIRKRVENGKLFGFQLTSGKRCVTVKRSRNLAGGLLLAGIIFMVIGAAGPRWNKREIEVTTSGRDVVFLMDVSRSMTARDLKPDRMEHAKYAIIDAIPSLAGNRVALVAFAGNSVIKCPLTRDYSFFQTAVLELSPDSVSRGGSLIGDAIRKVMKEVFTGEGSFKDIVLITDGEDQESMPLQAAVDAGEKGIRLIALGLGDESTGYRIPAGEDAETDGFLTYEGEEIWTRLDSQSLRQMCASTPGGAYLNVATGTVDLKEIINTLNRGEKGSVTEKKVEWDQKFQISLLLGLFCLLLSQIIRVRHHL